MVSNTKLYIKVFFASSIPKHILSLLRIKENVKKMFDGYNFWNICGVWEKFISLFLIFIRKFMGFLTFFLPVFLLYLYAGYLEKCKSELPDNVSAWWMIIFMVVLLTHGTGGVFYGVYLKECMKGFTIGWLRLNLILVLALVGLQVYVSYVHNVQIF